jgi:hypothetical protein
MDLNAPCRLVRQERQFAGGCVSAASRKLVHRRDKLAGVHLRIRNQCYSALGSRFQVAGGIAKIGLKNSALTSIPKTGIVHFVFFGLFVMRGSYEVRTSCPAG